MNKILKSISFITLLLIVLVIPYLVFANPMTDRLENVGEGGGYAQADSSTLSEFIGQIVNVALSFLGIVFVILIILGGYKWMTARGNEEQAKEGSTILRRAIIGLIITAGSWAIWLFVSTIIIGN
jgi:cytochrome bd-type quinol oxidase subunit 2